MSTETGSSPDRTLARSVCLGCGCTCDDIDVVVRAARITEARNACPIGVQWFGDGTVPARVKIAGRDAVLEDAFDSAARLLTDAGRPLVYLAPDLSCEAQRHAAAVADHLCAVLDSVTSATALPSVLAAQERGRASATLGEIRNRADLLVFWGVDPERHYPRFWTRYAPEPAGLHVADGRSSRKVVAVDVGKSLGPSDADLRVTVPPEDEVATLTALRAVLTEKSGAAAAPSDRTAWSRARMLAPSVLAARYAAVVADAEPDELETFRDPGRSAALIALTQALNGPTRGALSLLRAGGNRSGADAVLTWQTGYPAAIDFARGYPRYRPHDGTAAARLAAGEVDAVLVVGSAAQVPAEIRTAMARLRCVAMGPHASQSSLSECHVVIDTGVAGIHEAGTVIRMDDVPLPLRASLNGPPAAAEIIAMLLAKLRT